METRGKRPWGVGRVLIELIHLCRPHGWRVALVGIPVTLAAGATALVPIITRRVVDAFGDVDTVRPLVLVWLALGVVAATFEAVAGISAQVLATAIVAPLRDGLYRRLLERPPTDVDDPPLGTEQATVDALSTRIAPFISSAVRSVPSSLALLAGAVAGMVAVEATWAVAAFVVVPLLGASVIWLARFQARWGAYERDANAAMLGLRAATLSPPSLEVVRDNGVGAPFAAEHQRIGAIFDDAALRRARASNLYNAAIDVIVGAFAPIVLLVGTLTAASPATAIAFAFVLPFVLWRLHGLATVLQDAGAAAPYLELVLRTFADRGPRRTPDRPTSSIEGPIVLRDVGVERGGSRIVQDVTVTVPERSWTAIVGRSGAGKTTLINVICGARHPNEGSASIGSVQINSIPAELLVEHLRVVRPTPVLFPMRLRQNLLLFAPDAGAADIYDVLEIVGLDPSLLDRLPGVDEISQGERQRVAIARALLVKPQVLLIDEALASLDAVTTRWLQQELRARRPELTVIQVSHRPTPHADQIVALRDGRIAETGTHAELMRHGGVYAELMARRDSNE